MANRTAIDLAGLLARANEAFFVLNERGALAHGNRAFGELLEVPASTDPAVRKALSELLRIPDDLPAGTARRVERVWGTGPRRRWFHVLFIALSDPNGASLGVLGHVTVGKPADRVPKSVDSLTDERLDRLREEQTKRWGFHAVAARGEGMQRVLHQLRLAVGSAEPVTLIGESGTGKTTLARVVHHERFGATGSFVVLDCESLSFDVQRRLLFGRLDVPDPNSPEALGLLRAPGAGTLLVRHPLDLAADLQKEIVKRFSDRSAPWRLMVTTRMPLEDSRVDGRLIDSFYHLSSTLPIHLPPLRQRGMEFADTCRSIVANLPMSSGQRVHTIDPGAMELLAAYDWPGNLRELHTVLSTAASRASGGFITRSDLPRRIRRAGPGVAPETVQTNSTPSLDRLLEEVERRMLQRALTHSGGNKSQAAKSLGISRARFQRRWEQLATPSRPAPSGRSRESADPTQFG